MARLIIAIVAKWVVVFGVLLVGFLVFKLPALALLAGIAVGDVPGPGDGQALTEFN